MFDLCSFCNLFVTRIFTVSKNEYPVNTKYHIVRKCLNHGIVFAVSGAIQFTYRGQAYVCDAEHAVLIPGGTEYDYCALEENTQLAVINFFTTEEFDPDDFQYFKIDNVESFLSDHAAMNKIYTGGSLTATPEVLTIFYKIITRLINTVGKNMGQQSSWRIIEYINDHISSPDLTVSHIAEAAGFSEVHFRKLFKNYYGVSPKQYVQSLRIDRAKRLLEISNDSISSIAKQCGFSTMFYFSKLFKEKTGYSPYEYREHYRCLY